MPSSCLPHFVSGTNNEVLGATKICEIQKISSDCAHMNPWCIYTVNKLFIFIALFLKTIIGEVYRLIRTTNGHCLWLQAPLCELHTMKMTIISRRHKAKALLLLLLQRLSELKSGFILPLTLHYPILNISRFLWCACLTMLNLRETFECTKPDIYPMIRLWFL